MRVLNPIHTLTVENCSDGVLRTAIEMAKREDPHLFPDAFDSDLFRRQVKKLNYLLSVRG